MAIITLNPIKIILPNLNAFKWSPFLTILLIICRVEQKLLGHNVGKGYSSAFLGKQKCVIPQSFHLREASLSFPYICYFVSYLLVDSCYHYPHPLDSVFTNLLFASP